MDGRRISLEREQELLDRILAGQSTRQISREMRLARETIESRRIGSIRRVFGDDEEEEEIRLELTPEQQARLEEIRAAKIAKGEAIPRGGRFGHPHEASSRDFGLAPDINPL